MLACNQAIKLAISDVDSDIVTVIATALTVEQKDSTGAVVSSSSQQPTNSDILAMLSLSPTPALDGTQDPGRFDLVVQFGQ